MEKKMEKIPSTNYLIFSSLQTKTTFFDSAETRKKTFTALSHIVAIVVLCNALKVVAASKHMHKTHNTSRN